MSKQLKNAISQLSVYFINKSQTHRVMTSELTTVKMKGSLIPDFKQTFKMEAVEHLDDIFGLKAEDHYMIYLMKLEKAKNVVDYIVVILVSH